MSGLQQVSISGIKDLQRTIDQLNAAIAAIGQTGIPKLVSYQYVIPATTDGQTTVTIPLETFDSSTDTLFVYRNTTIQSTNMYSVSGRTITLVTPVAVASDTTFHLMILKNVPIGPDGAVNASVLLNGSVTDLKLSQTLQTKLTQLTEHLDNTKQFVEFTKTVLQMLSPGTTTITFDTIANGNDADFCTLQSGIPTITKDGTYLVLFYINKNDVTLDNIEVRINNQSPLSVNKDFKGSTQVSTVMYLAENERVNVNVYNPTSGVFSINGYGSSGTIARLS